MGGDFLSCKKEALIFYASPKKNGFTASVLNKVVENLSSKYNFSTIDAYKSNIKPCIDCGVCKVKDGCQFDDFDEIDFLLGRCDLIIVASPVYNLSFPSPLKAIFDRMQRYYMARFLKKVQGPMLKPKNGIMILTCGSDDLSGIDISRKQLKMIFTTINTKLVGEIVMKNTDTTPETQVIPNDLFFKI